MKNTNDVSNKCKTNSPIAKAMFKAKVHSAALLSVGSVSLADGWKRIVKDHSLIAAVEVISAAVTMTVGISAYKGAKMLSELNKDFDNSLDIKDDEFIDDKCEMD